MEQTQLDIAEIAGKADKFRPKLEAIKARIKLEEPGWYPYDTLSMFTHLQSLLTEDRRFLLKLAGGAPVLDLGCADGSLAFFLESLGCTVDAADNPVINHNEMRGLCALHKALRSAVKIHITDLDAAVTLPRERYGLTFFLGVLYHLKNPFGVLEALARRTEYCVFSTRVARFAPDRKTSLHALPVAYLLDDAEANDDSTNHWIFSEAGLRRLLRRTGWEVRDYLSTGNTFLSDPASGAGDERAFCLLESRFASHMRSLDLVAGWHAVEDGRWRWTERRFSVVLPAPRGGSATLQFRFTLPDALIERLHQVTLTATVNGASLPPQTYTTRGDHAYIRHLAVLPAGDPVRVDFELDRALAPTSSDARELGVLVAFTADSPLPVSL